MNAGRDACSHSVDLATQQNFTGRVRGFRASGWPRSHGRAKFRATMVYQALAWHQQPVLLHHFLLAQPAGFDATPPRPRGRGLQRAGWPALPPGGTRRRIASAAQALLPTTPPQTTMSHSWAPQPAAASKRAPQPRLSLRASASAPAAAPASGSPSPSPLLSSSLAAASPPCPPSSPGHSRTPGKPTRTTSGGSGRCSAARATPPRRRRPAGMGCSTRRGSSCGEPTRRRSSSSSGPGPGPGPGGRR